MKLLFDQNLSFKLIHLLADIFPICEQVGRLGHDQADDRTIWEYAKAHGYILVTQDSDFADLAAILGPPPKVVWLRCGNQPTSVIETLLRHHARRIMALADDTATDCLEIFS